MLERPVSLETIPGSARRFSALPLPSTRGAKNSRPSAQQLRRNVQLFCACAFPPLAGQKRHASGTSTALLTVGWTQTAAELGLGKSRLGCTMGQFTRKMHVNSQPESFHTAVKRKHRRSELPSQLRGLLRPAIHTGNPA